MFRRWYTPLVAGVLGLGLWLGSATPAKAQDANLTRFHYYPYYYFPHNYWPSEGPPYPERPGEPYMRPPAYMAFPPFKEKNWRYELWQPMLHYRGAHFWLDQF